MGCFGWNADHVRFGEPHGEAAGGERLAGIERIGDAVDAHQRDARAPRRRAHRADRLVAGHDTGTPASGERPSSSTVTLRVRAVPRCCMRETTSWPT